MRGIFERTPSPAMAVAFLALLAALTGTAAALPGHNTVRSDDIVNGQVKTQDIRNGTVRGKDIRNGTVKSADVGDGSLTGADIADDSLTGADVNEGTLGTVPNASHSASASTASTVSPGAIGASELGTVIQRQAAVPLNDGTANAVNVGCAPGEKMLGGGSRVVGGGSDITMISSGPVAGVNAGNTNPANGAALVAWRTAANNETGGPTGNTTLRGYAICLP